MDQLSRVRPSVANPIVADRHPFRVHTAIQYHTGRERRARGQSESDWVFTHGSYGRKKTVNGAIHPCVTAVCERAATVCATLRVGGSRSVSPSMWRNDGAPGKPRHGGFPHSVRIARRQPCVKIRVADPTSMSLGTARHPPFGFSVSAPLLACMSGVTIGRGFDRVALADFTHGLKPVIQGFFRTKMPCVKIRLAIETARTQRSCPLNR